MKIIEGNIEDALELIDDDTIDLIITSPPYYGLRAYSDNPMEIGREEHPKLYIDRIVNIVDILMQKLKKDGNFFLNIGDSYATASHKGSFDPLLKSRNELPEHKINIRSKLNKSNENWLKERQKLLIPYRIAIAIQDIGYTIREDLIWVKKLTFYPERESIGTTFPFPVIDKFLPAHEVILHITKSKGKSKAYIDRVKNKLKQSSIKRANYKLPSSITSDWSAYHHQEKGFTKLYNKLKNADVEMANPTSCIMFKRFSGFDKNEGHVAPFPIHLPMMFIEAYSDVGDVVMDPFMGSGTTGLASRLLNRSFIGIELEHKYVEIAKRKMKWNNALDIKFEYIKIKR